MEELDVPPILEPLREHIESSLRPRLSLAFRDDAGSSVEGTRMGGEPACDASATWPLGANGPMSFVGQLDFGELSRFASPDLGIPNDGVLALFYDLSAGPKRGDASSLQSIYKLVWSPRGSNARPPPSNARQLPRRVLERARADIPSMPHYLLDYVPMAWPDWDRAVVDDDTGEEVSVREAYAAFSYGDVPNQVMGNANWVQQDPRVAELTPPEEWSLLWQLTPHASWNVAHDSRLFILTRNEDLANQEFSRTYLTWQIS